MNVSCIVAYNSSYSCLNALKCHGLDERRNWYSSDHCWRRGRFQSCISVMSLHCLALDGTRITIKYALYLQYHIIYTYNFVDNNTLYHGTTKRHSLQIAKQWMYYYDANSVLNLVFYLTNTITLNKLILISYALKCIH